jgi:hypothetical protein
VVDFDHDIYALPHVNSILLDSNITQAPKYLSLRISLKNSTERNMSLINIVKMFLINNVRICVFCLIQTQCFHKNQ